MKRRDFTKSMIGIFGAVMLAPEVFVGELVPVPIGTIVTTAGFNLKEMAELINSCSGWQAWQYGEDDDLVAVVDAQPCTIIQMPYVEDEDGNITYQNSATCSIDESGSLILNRRQSDE